ncbi:uncharacterized protein LOC112539973 isoform X2 [Tetranychus urticae]|uniref:uncharacterized protein LOC112539973 isoform X2 n=1 Tax=Tetranychus urticae TaxID=32264 RepID=UPI000D64DECC|nr:uncharacterized protein LOC112539973 isoform X2 [Tetranychus urticae]
MFPSKYFVLIFFILYNLTRLSEGYYQGYKELSGLGTNFFLKAKLIYKEYNPNNYGSIVFEKYWLIEESVFGDEKNSIVTLITEEEEGIETKLFRDFKTQNISLICVQNECGRNADLLDKNLKGLIPSIAQTVKAALLLGPYRMILCETSENQLYIYRGNWKFETGSYSCGTLYLAPSFTDSGRTIKCMGMRDSNNNEFVDARFNRVNLSSCIKQTESLEKANVSTKGIFHRFNESITKYDELKVDKEHRTTKLSITSLDSVTSVEIINERSYLELFVYDRKFGLKYIPSGLNECTIESSGVDEGFNYVASENYAKAFAKELYFPKNPVKSHSKKLLVETEHNVMAGNVKFDLAVKTYLEPHNASRFAVESGRLENFCVQMDLYSKSFPNEISSNFNLTEVRVMCLLETSTYLDGDELHRIISSYHQCFKDRKNKIILRLEISSTSKNYLMSDKIRKLQADINHVKDALRSLLIDKLNVSFLRINWIKLNFSDSYIVAKVEIVDSFVTYFESKKGVSHKFNIKSSESGQIQTSTIDECLRLQAFKANLSYVITCETDYYLCLGIADGHALPDEDKNGLDCMLYNNSDQSLTKLKAEVPLEEIEKSCLNLQGSKFNYSDVEFFVVDVTIGDGIRFYNPEKTKSNSTSPFFLIISILIIIIFFAFGSGYKLSQNRIHPLRDYVSLKLLKSSI